MDQKSLLMDLEEAFDQLSCGLNAIKLMVMGLEDVDNPYTDGFYAVWRYLEGARKEMARLLAAVSTAGTGA